MSDNPYVPKQAEVLSVTQEAGGPRAKAEVLRYWQEYQRQSDLERFKWALRQGAHKLRDEVAVLRPGPAPKGYYRYEGDGPESDLGHAIWVFAGLHARHG